MKKSSNPTIEETAIGPYRVERLEAGKAWAEVIPSLGGMVKQIALPFPNAKEPIPILREDSQGELSSNPWFRGRILFPFNDRIPDGEYTFNGKAFHLTPNSEKDGYALHGLIYNRPLSSWKQEKGKDSVTLTLTGQILPVIYPGYPFSLLLEMTYTISMDGFSLTFFVKNRGTEPAPIAFGWHPYFTLGGIVDNWKLFHCGTSYVPVGEDLMPQGGHAGVIGTRYDYRSGRVIGNEPLDIALTSPLSGTASLTDGEKTISYWADSSVFSYTQLFIPPERDSIAIEPITAATNSFNLPDLGRRILMGGEEITASVHITLAKA